MKQKLTTEYRLKTRGAIFLQNIEEEFPEYDFNLFWNKKTAANRSEVKNTGSHLEGDNPNTLTQKQVCGNCGRNLYHCIEDDTLTCPVCEQETAKATKFCKCGNEIEDEQYDLCFGCHAESINCSVRIVDKKEQVSQSKSLAGQPQESNTFPPSKDGGF